MDADLLRSWLDLPPGAWPPADRALLGLPTDGPLDPAAVEAAALDRMARLRTHQLLHPDLVTEGMNRVAQAMMAVGTAAAPRRKVPSPVPPKPPPTFELAPPPVTLTLAVTAVPRILDAVPVVAEPPVAAVAPPPAFRKPPPVEPIPIPADQPPPAGLALDDGEIPPHARRPAYRELAGLRAVVRAFDQLRPSVALPGEGLLTPAAVCELLEATAAFRSAATHPGLNRGFVRRLAPGLTAVLGNPLPLAVFRSLTRPQRLELAREWAGGRAGLHARIDAVRAGLTRPHRGDPAGDIRRRLAGILADSPELALVAATALIGLVAVARTAGR